MKKFAYLLTLVFVLAFATTSCEKDDEQIVPETLAEKYPEWVDLQWYSTNDDVNAYPRFSYSIEDNTITEVSYDINGIRSTFTYDKIVFTTEGGKTKVTVSNDITNTWWYYEMHKSEGYVLLWVNETLKYKLTIN